jgi:hypothetical protein
MNKYTLLILLSISFFASPLKAQFKKVVFPSNKKIDVTADLYHISDEAPVLLLCHQASYSRGEYRETAKIFNELGYNCMAIDQRSGKSVNGVENLTAKAARAKNRPTGYLDAEADILAGLDYLVDKYDREVILLGSSYSASLVLKIAKESEDVKAVLAFSPGEYFGDDLNLTETISGLEKPVFVTSSRGEITRTRPLAAVMSNCEQFAPERFAGQHGSKALWSSNEGSEMYWEAVKGFLERIK